ETLKTRSTAEWLKLLEEADIPAMPMHTLDSLLEDPHLQAIGFFKEEDHPSLGRILTMDLPGRWSASKPEVRRHAPELGEHSREILQAIVYGDEPIAQLIKEQVVHQHAEDTLATAHSSRSSEGADC